MEFNAIHAKSFVKYLHMSEASETGEMKLTHDQLPQYFSRIFFQRSMLYEGFLTLILDMEIDL